MEHNLNRYWKYTLVAIVGIFCLLYYELIFGRQLLTHDSLVWFGSFTYYIDQIAAGNFPYWDPYLTMGTYFYPKIPQHGSLDPLALIFVGLRKLFNLNLLSLYVYFRIVKMVIFLIGANYFFRHVSGCRTSALVSAGILLFALPHGYFPQAGALESVYLTPFALLCVIRLIEVDEVRQRYYSLAVLALITGISMNIYIPVLYIFNLAVFLIAAIGLWNGRGFAFAGLLRREMLLAISSAIILALMMAAPAVVTFYGDASGEGELFPLQRILEKNNRIFKIMPASEIGASNLSDEFTKKEGIFNSTGNLVGMFFPDSPRTLPLLNEQDLISYIHMYIGIIPLVVAVIGLLYFRSRYKHLILIMTVVVIINGFSFSGVHDRPYNVLQTIFNSVFPPLKMYQGRENFGFFFMFYICAFLSMGLSMILSEGDFLWRKRYQIAGICISVILLKAAISSYFGGKYLFNSEYDILIILQLLLLGIVGFLSGKKTRIRHASLVVLFLVVFADLGIYNRLFMRDILQDGRPFYETMASIDSTTRHARGDFQFFREPIVELPFSHPVAYEETIGGMKGALSYGFNHGLFATRRYYDLLTHVPLESQFVLNGMVYPVVRFFPLERAIEVKDRGELLAYYSRASAWDIAYNLFIEDPTSGKRGSASMSSLNRYQDATWLSFENIYYSYASFVDRNRQFIADIRNNPRQFLHTEDYSVDVRDFSSNAIAIEVKNRIDGYLYYNDGWSRYWKAFDGDRELPVMIANYNSKAVFLNKGDHLIRFVFDPAYYKIALAAYYAGLLLSICLTVFFYLRRKREIP